MLLGLLCLGILPPCAGMAHPDQEPVSEACPVEPAVAEEEPSWGWEYRVSAWSQYVWRGVVLNDEAVLQPEFFVYRSFADGSYLGGGLFWSQDLTDVAGRRGEVSELDYCAEWGREGESLALAAGASAYTYPDSGVDGTVEGYLTCDWLGWRLTPHLELWCDPVEAHGFYLRGALLCEHEVTSRWVWCWQAWFSSMDRNYADYNVGARTAGFADAGAQVQFGFLIGEGSRLDLMAIASTQVEDAYRDVLDDPDPLWFGLVWAQEF